MLTLMSDEATARLQIDVPEWVRRRLKAQAAEQGLDMGALGGAILDHGLGLIASGKAPAALKTIIEEAVAAKAKRGEAE